MKQLKGDKYLETGLIRIGLSPTIVSVDDSNKIIFEWRKNYLAKNRSKKGDSCDFDYMDKDKCGNDAVAEYSALSNRAIEYYIRIQWNEEKSSLAECKSKLPISNSIAQMFSGKDVYIFPKSMKWTFVITHENGGIGDPFYSKVQKVNCEEM